MKQLERDNANHEQNTRYQPTTPNQLNKQYSIQWCKIHDALDQLIQLLKKKLYKQNRES